MFVPTHQFEGQLVRQEGNAFFLANGVRLRSVKKSDLVPVEPKRAALLPESLRIALQAASDAPGPQLRPGWATNVRGDVAERVNQTQVRLCVATRDGHKKYLIDIPETISILALEVE